jgi:hypothetical protein
LVRKEQKWLTYFPLNFLDGESFLFCDDSVSVEVDCRELEVTLNLEFLVLSLDSVGHVTVSIAHHKLISDFIIIHVLYYSMAKLILHLLMILEVGGLNLKEKFIFPLFVVVQ